MHRENTFAEGLHIYLLIGLILLAAAGPVFAEAPSLPRGLGSGTAETVDSGPPALPSGLGVTEELPPPEERTHPEDASTVQFGGFADARSGIRINDDPGQADSPLREVRLQLELEKDWDSVSFRTVADLLFDGIFYGQPADLETGDGALDLREASLLYRASSRLDLKAGRQILTWGTGDLIFINDLFPKDWNSFFIGRDMEYLKAPSDALKISIYTATVNLDVAYTPRFDPDRYIDGRRISYYNPSLNEISGRENPLAADVPADWHDDETAARLYWTFKSYETALYGYDGYWKSPNGFDGASGLFTFPRLAVLGASIRGPVWGGIGNAEAGYYDSLDDRAGSDPLVRNSEWRGLIGFEKELASDLTGSFQYYLEQMADYGEYMGSLTSGTPAKARKRQVMTVRLTRLAVNQNLRLSLFNFYSPGDEDGYLRLSSLYKVNDATRLELGGNFFYGKESYTFFGQFKDSSNIFAGVRTEF
jgi:hypothetical protein